MPIGSVVDVVAHHVDADGSLLSPHTAAVEPLNVIRPTTAFEFVPQGGGDPRTHHRCPGEQVTVGVLSALAVRLARLDAEAPEQDLTISLRRIPARPASGVVLRVRG